MSQIVITGSTGVTRSAPRREPLERLGAWLEEDAPVADDDPQTNAEIDAAPAAAVGVDALSPRTESWDRITA